jgi:MerR family transcriptional regulator/heat shock protein HspR
MSTPPPTAWKVPPTGSRVEVRLSAAELAAAAGISPTMLVRLLRLGLVEPEAGGPSEFTAATAARLRRMLRLHRDLGVNLTGAAIIVDLLERLEGLEAELARLRSGP